MPSYSVCSFLRRSRILDGMLSEVPRGHPLLPQMRAYLRNRMRGGRSRLPGLGFHERKALRNEMRKYRVI